MRGIPFAVELVPTTKKKKNKSNSDIALYECIGFDVFKSERRLKHVAQFYHLPNDNSGLAPSGEAEEVKDSGEARFNSVPR